MRGGDQGDDPLHDVTAVPETRNPVLQQEPWSTASVRGECFV